MLDMNSTLPLSALLSQVPVTFTIEFDNKAEHRLLHRTSNHGGTTDSLHAPWLVSMVMWFNCMRFVMDEDIAVWDLEGLARTATNLDGMRRWGYVRFAQNGADDQSTKPRADAILRRLS